MSDSTAARQPQGIGTRRTIRLARLKDSYALILVFILLDYIAASVAHNPWSRVVVAALLAATLLLAFRVAGAPRIWVTLSAIFMFVSILAAIGTAFIPGAGALSQIIPGIGGTLLILAPLVILRHIAASTHVTGETILGAVCVYLLWGMSFACIFSLVDALSPGEFFVEHSSERPASDFLFFSYTTLTTVGYGNLVPVGPLGQALAMVEALLGQIYLVVVVARGVSLWGQGRSASSAGRFAAPPSPETQSDAGSTPRTNAASPTGSDDWQARAVDATSAKGGAIMNASGSSGDPTVSKT